MESLEDSKKQILNTVFPGKIYKKKILAFKEYRLLLIVVFLMRIFCPKHRAIYNNGDEVGVLYLAFLAEEIRDGRESL